jgi:replicative DNA helicase
MANHESKTGRVPPSNIEAEQATLGSILLDYQRAIDQVMLILKPADFFRRGHQMIYEAMLDMEHRNEAIDLITLSDELASRKEIDQIGGSSYLASLTSVVPTASNVEYYANIVRENAIRRNLLRISGETTDDAFDMSQDIGQVIDTAERKIFEIADGQIAEGFKHVKTIINPTITLIESNYNSKGAVRGVTTGYHELDDMLDGFQNSEFIIIGARPSIGKTALALSMARHAAIKNKIPTGFFSLEMADQQLMMRLLSMEAHLDATKMRKGILKPNDFHSIMDAAGYIYDSPLLIADTPNMRLLDLKAQARRMKAQHDIKIVFIDYLSIIAPENNSVDRHLQVAEISRSLKALARELEIPVVALSQVSRDTEGKPPHLASLRESGAIEQDADVVLFLHRERSDDNRAAQNETGIETQLIVAKNRNGPIGTIDINFLPQYAEFVELARYVGQG